MVDSSYTHSSTMSASDTAAFLLVMLLVCSVFLVFYAIPITVAFWKLFEKAGKPGWAAIIPLYNTWVEVEIARAPQWIFWASIASAVFGFIPGVSLAGLIITIYLIVLIARQYDRSPSFWWLLYLLPIVGVFQVDKASYKTAPVAPGAGPGVPPTPPAPAA